MICSESVRVLLLAVLALVVVREGKTGSVRWPRIRSLNLDSSLPELSAYRENLEHSTVEEIIEELQVCNEIMQRIHACAYVHNVMQAHTHVHTLTHAYTSHRTWVHYNHINNYYNIMQLRSRRQTGSSTPTPHGNYLFAGDGNQYARIYYSGSPSPVSLPPCTFSAIMASLYFQGIS